MTHPATESPKATTGATPNPERGGLVQSHMATENNFFVLNLLFREVFLLGKIWLEKILIVDIFHQGKNKAVA
jgi:hypothetical protein